MSKAWQMESSCIVWVITNKKNRLDKMTWVAKFIVCFLIYYKIQILGFSNDLLSLWPPTLYFYSNIRFSFCFKFPALVGFMLEYTLRKIRFFEYYIIFFFFLLTVRSVQRPDISLPFCRHSGPTQNQCTVLDFMFGIR